LQNNTTNLNLAFNNGTYRIVRNFYTYYNGSEFNSGAVTTIDKSCIEILSPLLTFSQALQIVDVYRMPCSASGNLDVIISALGTLPLHYTITEKDGLPFSFDNGNSNIFVNLPPGVYTFQVEDNCGNITSRPLVDVNALLSLVTITQPDDIVDCQATITGNETFDITSVSATILGAQSPTDYTISYYTSLADAQSASNSITNLTNFNPTTNPQTIYVRVIFNQLPNCYQTTSFELIVGQIPELNLNPTYFDCSTTPIVIDASTTNLPTTTYEWSNGVTGPIVTISQLGETNLTVTATNLYGSNNQTCTNTKDITVTISQLPAVDHIETVDWTDTENSITVFTTNNGAFEYSIDGINYQDDATFSNLWAGLYTVYIRDKNGCGTLEQEVWLLNYPKFFTPNGDGFNDTWYIKNSQFEPNFKVEIFDRFGKFITRFDSTSFGWDGNYNNKQLLSTDYWFVVYREDGRIYKGHFAMKR
jgi:gliding motility-associated-like protein